MTQIKCIPHVAPPTFCAECFNRTLAAATAAQNNYCSTYCEHNRALLTAQLCDHNGERVIHAWNLTGPVSYEQAVEGMRQAAQSVGAEPVILQQVLN